MHNCIEENIIMLECIYAAPLKVYCSLCTRLQQMDCAVKPASKLVCAYVS
jgi:hypothetical protein